MFEGLQGCDPKGRRMDALMAASGAAAGACEPAAVGENKAALVTDGRLDDQPLRRMEALSHMPHVSDDLLF